MKVSFKSLFFLFLTTCLLCGSGGLCAQNRDSLAMSQVPVDVRLPDPEKVKALQADKDFQYFEETTTNNTFLERLMYKLKKWLNKIFYQGQTSGFWEFLLYAALVVAVVFIIIKMLKVDMSGLLGKKAVSVEIPYDIVEENIHELDLESLIDEAVTQHEYRKAIRLHYLQSLKRLTDAGLIHWKPGKTNRSYSTEIQNTRLRHEFEQLTSMFEYVWYGGAALGETLFEDARQEFIQFDTLLKQQA